MAKVEDVLDEVSRIKTIVTDAAEEGARSAMKAVKRGRHAAEDAMDEARHAVKRNPLQALAIGFAAGVAAGSLAVWLGGRRR
jgi:ElaB/YqjD/DUF883 family membrane-anchored ribosome-binding protein